MERFLIYHYQDCRWPGSANQFPSLPPSRSPSHGGIFDFFHFFKIFSVLCLFESDLSCGQFGILQAILSSDPSKRSFQAILPNDPSKSSSQAILPNDPSKWSFQMILPNDPSKRSFPVILSSDPASIHHHQPCTTRRSWCLSISESVRILERVWKRSEGSLRDRSLPSGRWYHFAGNLRGIIDRYGRSLN